MLLQSDELPADGHLPVRTEMSESPEAVVVTGGTSFSPVSTVLLLGGAVEHAAKSATPARPTQRERRPHAVNAVMMTSRFRRRERRDPMILPLLATLTSDSGVGQGRAAGASIAVVRLATSRPRTRCSRAPTHRQSPGAIDCQG